MKPLILSMASLAAPLLALIAFAQTAPHPHPAPTNLQVLSKNITGTQLHEIMEQWSDALGTHCNACHVADAKTLAANGHVPLDFADDSKPEKAIARSMLQMMNDINQKYLAKMDTSGEPVTCGTCHRGHFGPPPFIAPSAQKPAPPPAKK